MTIVAIWFLFSPLADRLQRSETFLANLFCAFGFVAISSTVAGVMGGSVQPLVKGLDRFDRAGQPRRFWASVVWNACAGCLMFWAAWQNYSGLEKTRCFRPPDKLPLSEAIAACTALLTKAKTQEERGFILKTRGIWHDQLKNYAKAIADYSEAISIDGTDSHSLYNRSSTYKAVGQYKEAIADLDAYLRLVPRDFDALYWRGKFRLDDRQFEAAIRDLSAAHEIKPREILPIANRGIAYAWLDNVLAAQRDLEAVRAIDPSHVAIPRIASILSYRAKDTDAAITQLSRAIALNPEDLWSLKLRADLYWDIGERDLARDDDDRIAAINQRKLGPGWDGK